mgnify:CR=1 FL=1
MDNTKKQIIEDIEILIKANKDNQYCDKYWLADEIKNILKNYSL